MFDADLRIPKPPGNRGARTPYQPTRIILRVAPKKIPLSPAVAASRPGSPAVAGSRTSNPVESHGGRIPYNKIPLSPVVAASL